MDNRAFSQAGLGHDESRKPTDERLAEDREARIADVVQFLVSEQLRGQRRPEQSSLIHVAESEPPKSIGANLELTLVSADDRRLGDRDDLESEELGVDEELIQQLREFEPRILAWLADNNRNSEQFALEPLGILERFLSDEVKESLRNRYQAVLPPLLRVSWPALVRLQSAVVSAELKTEPEEES